MAEEPGPGKTASPACSESIPTGLPDTFAELGIRGLPKLLNSPDLSPRNKDLIVTFLNHISAEVSERRLTFYTHKLRRLASWLRKDFDSTTEQDLRALVTFMSRGNARLDGRKFSPGTVHGYKVTLKRFYRWLEGDDEEYPRKVRWIKTNGDTTRIREPEDLLTADEIVEMIRHARNPRDKAIVSFLYESGARSGEMLAMKVRHLEFLPTIVKATLPVSKTRPRVVPLVSCRTHLAAWVNYHPLKDDPEAPLWSCLERRGTTALLGQTVGHILKAIAADAGIRKRIYPHLFRACSITHKQACGWPEQAIKKFHGLSKDSKVMKHYSHLSYANLEEIQCRMNGLPVDDPKGANRGIECSACGKANPLFVETCECGQPVELRGPPRAGPGLEAEIEARLEEKLRTFMQSRELYDRLAERFLTSLSAKAEQSPLLQKAISEISGALDRQDPSSVRSLMDCQAAGQDRPPPGGSGVTPQPPFAGRVCPATAQQLPKHGHPTG